jgi:hypothetical protein
MSGCGNTGQHQNKRQRKTNIKYANASDTPSVRPIKPQPRPDVFDASRFSVDAIKRMQKVRPSWADRLDYLHCPDTVIQQVFVNQKVIATNGGNLFPPLAMQRTSRTLVDFYSKGPTQQKELIKKYAVFENKLKAIDKTNHCQSITLFHVKQSTMNDERREKVENGFPLLMRESKQIAYQLQDPDNMRWPEEYCIPIIGALTMGSGVDEHIEWTVEDVPDFPFDSLEYKHTLVRHVNCSKESTHNATAPCNLSFVNVNANMS